jgi:hypothetical protein
MLNYGPTNYSIEFYVSIQNVENILVSISSVVVSPPVIRSFYSR